MGGSLIATKNTIKSSHAAGTKRNFSILAILIKDVQKVKKSTYSVGEHPFEFRICRVGHLDEIVRKNAHLMGAHVHSAPPSLLG